MTCSTRAFGVVISVLALILVCGCQQFRQFMRDPAGDNHVFTGDPTVFVGKEVILQFRWGDPEMYGSAIRCLLLRVEPDALVVRGLKMTEGSYPLLYAKLERLGKLSPVGDTTDVFRVRRGDINTLFEPSAAEGRHP
jgi:hypothetical protein